LLVFFFLLASFLTQLNNNNQNVHESVSRKQKSDFSH
jgi:hypothetical protein